MYFRTETKCGVLGAQPLTFAVHKIQGISYPAHRLLVVIGVRVLVVDTETEILIT